MEIVTAIFTPVVESLMVPIKKQLGYLISCTKYVTDMGNRRNDLEPKRQDAEAYKDYKERSILAVPMEVVDWLRRVGEIDEKVANISDDVGGCFNIKRRHKLGRKAFKIIEEINRLIEESPKINGPDHPIPPGKVDSKKATTSTPSSHHNDFPSRERTFMEALEQLQLNDHKSRMIALCGMGGVGKTTMMEKLNKVAKEKALFDMIVKVAIGQDANLIEIQNSIAYFLGIDLKESNKDDRANKLEKSFAVTYNQGKKKILVILDDVWVPFDLKDIGLSPLPNQGVGFKFLLTSRIRDVCITMGDNKVYSILNVDTITEQEAQSFFHQCVKISDGDDLDFNLRKIGDDIANRCHGLPMAIKTIASYLKCYRSDRHVWEDTLSSLKNKKVDEAVNRIFEISYNHLQNEEIRSTLLLCGLFPEDFDTPREDLVRYGWGFRLFKNVHAIREARNRLNTYIEQLINANLLIRSQLVNHVKMHDLVRAFVLKVCSNGEHASIVGDVSKWTEASTSDFCKRISLSCTGVSHSKFPEDLYQGMEKLQVIAYDKYPLLTRSLQCCTNLRTLCLSRFSPMFDFSSIENLSNLEVLSFAHCWLRKLPSTIGNLKELKLLDLTGCVNLIIDDGVLKNLINLEELYVKVGTTSRFRDDKEGIRFSDSICNELSGLSKNLFALEIEFFDNNTLPKNMSFKKLERFKISLGCYLNGGDDDDDDDDGQNRYENTLMLVTNKCELLDSRMNELFEKTEVLHLQVKDVNDLVKSLHHQQSSYYNLRVLKIQKCKKLRYLFTVGVANGLTKLERLTISSCPVLETLVGGERGEVGVIKLQVLKFLSLEELPKLMSLCNVVNVIELPQLEELILESLPNFTSIYPEATSSMSNDISTMQASLNKEVVIPKLKKLKIYGMKEIWPSNPMLLLHHLELSGMECSHVWKCNWNKFLIIPQNQQSFHNLTTISLWDCIGIEYLFSPLIAKLLSNLKKIHIAACYCFEEVVSNRDDEDEELVASTSTNTNTSFFPHLDILLLDKLLNLKCIGGGSTKISSTTPIHDKVAQVNDVSWSLCQYSRKIQVRYCRALPYVIPSYALEQMQKLEELEVYGCGSLVEVFETQGSNINGCDEGSGGNDATKLMKKINVPQLSNLKTLKIFYCDLLQHVFTFSTLESLKQLESLEIHNCEAMKVIVKEDNEDQTTISSKVVVFPHLKTIELRNLPNLTGFFLGKNEFEWPLLDDVMISTCSQMMVFTSGCSIAQKLNYIHTELGEHSIDQYGLNFPVTLHESLFSRLDTTSSSPTTSKGRPWSFHNLIEMNVEFNDDVKKIIPSNEFRQLQKLEKIKVRYCDLVEEVFEALEGTDGSELQSVVVEIPKLREVELKELENLKYIWKNNPWMVLEFTKLTKLSIKGCHSLEHVFSSSMVGSVLQLQDLHVEDCRKIKVIVKEANVVVEEGEEECDGKLNEIVMLPHLKSLTLVELPCLEGFCLGKVAFSWPSLDTLKIKKCKVIRVFTMGHSTTPKLRVIDTGFGFGGRVLVKEQDLNSFIINIKHQQGEDAWS